MKQNIVLSKLFKEIEKYYLCEYVYSLVSFKTRDDIIVYSDYVRIIYVSGNETSIELDDIKNIRFTNKLIIFELEKGSKVIRR